MGLRRIEGDLVVRGARFALAAARFNELVVERLLEGALDALRRHGAREEDLTVVRVPGAFELPLAAERLAASGRYQAVVALGCVVRGQTPHFEHVAAGCAQGLAQAALRHGVPVAFGVLTVDGLDQALERAGAKAGNKGAEAALAAIEIVNLLQALADEAEEGGSGGA